MSERARSGGGAGPDALLIEAALAALERDEDERAELALAACGPAGEWSARQALGWWLARERLAWRGRGERAPLPARALREVEAEAAPLAVEARVELAAAARREGDEATAQAQLARARSVAGAGGEGEARVAAEQAEALAASGRLAEAVAALKQAAEAWGALGASARRGRVELRIAELVGAGAASEEGAAAWLARAQVSLGDEATWRDRAALREGFRRVGRRLRDTALDDAAAGRLSAVEAAAAAVVALAGAEADLRRAGRAGAAGAVAERVQEQASVIVERCGELGEQLTAAAVEGARLRGLLDAVAELSAAAGPQALCERAVELAARLLDADRALLARAPGAAGEPPQLLACSGEPPAGWAQLVADGLAAGASAPAPPALRRQSELRGPTLAVRIERAEQRWVLGADRLLRGGRFDEAHAQLAEVFARYLGHALGWALSREAERRALAEVEAAFETIRDGVLSVDEQGVVRAANAAAARLLRRRELVGQRLADLAGLKGLASLLSPPRRVNGAVARLPQGSVVVTARPLPAAAGAVATLVELERAQRMGQSAVSARPRYTFDDVVGSSAATRELLRLARQAAQSDATALITGESGTGKEIFAQAIHSGGARADEPFVAINCAALPGGLLEAELFGYERGAFTGARAEGALGKLELAGEGTLLLDEIGDMPLDMQAKLLRVLQERVVVRLGSSVERPLHARILATTHRDLEQGVRQGTFRLDLFFRLGVLQLKLPPLRERPQDIPEIAQVLLRRAAEASSKAASSLGPEALRALLAHRWPGNVRELSNVLEREVALLAPDAPSLDRLRLPLAEPPAEPRLAESPSSARIRAAAALDSEPPADLIEPMSVVERRTYLRSLALSGGHVGRAAKALGVSRSRFYELLKEWGLGGEERSPDSLRRLAVRENKGEG